MAQGLEKGLQKGAERGRKDEAVAILDRLLTRRFGPLPQTAQKKLARASLPQLRLWTDALLDASSLKQVFK